MMKFGRLGIGATILAFAASQLFAAQVPALTDRLPSWNDGPAKKAIIEFVQTTTTNGSPKFVPPAERVATFNAEAKKWLETARDPRWKRPCRDLTYPPTQEVLKHLRANGYKTYVCTGGGQDFVRVYSEATYGIAPEQVVGTAGGTKYGYGKDGKPFLTKEPRLLLNDNNAGTPAGIHLLIGRRPYAAFGNSTGGRETLEYTGAGDGAWPMTLVLHDDAQREYAYGPALGMRDIKVGAFTRAPYDEAKKKGWTVISVKNDWKKIFAFE